jgi:hypothetical protein
MPKDASPKAAAAVMAAVALAAVAALRIVSLSPQGTFRRAGLTFGREPQFVPLASLTAEQVERLKAETMLAVTETTMPTAEPDADTAPQQSKSVDGKAPPAQ